MGSIYLAALVFLFALAIYDLFVGVSNDAVNFLQSAVGAKVARFRTIIIVASVGVLLGASMSNGMMDIARHGVFHPEMFSFKELMFIFLAVMVSDILLLDIFNNLGLPTSTTVSMVFELLGATAAFTVVKIHADPSLAVSDLMNTDKALGMITAIFVSVGIAFFFGALLQWLSRLLFTFAYKDGMKWKIGIFAGASFTAIVYFMLFKGIGGMSFATPELKSWINGNTLALLGGCFVGSTIVMQILHFLRVNVFKLLVLLGTFALAMAFAGNDLVNFIGVPLAGYSAYTDFASAGTGDAASYMMDSLNGSAKTSPLFLVAAGVIMVVALATSRKARKVIRTSVDLARQSGGDEMFGSSKIARVLVRTSGNVAAFIDKIVPRKVQAWVDARFDTGNSQMAEGAAFDEVRATVNLVVASLLIALGTSLKLPLSTTYVTFMVAMGSSLADKAWGRESAVYRITGVVSVIGGWLVTAGAAFCLSFILGTLMCFGSFVAAGLVMALAVFILVHTNKRFSQKEKEEKSDTLYSQIMNSTDKAETAELLKEHIFNSHAAFLDYAADTYSQVTDGFLSERLSWLRKAESSMRRKREELKSIRRKEMTGLRKLDPEVAMEKNTWFHLGRNSCEEMLYGLRRIAEPCDEHVDNHFIPVGRDERAEFLPLRDCLLDSLKKTSAIIRNGAWDEIDGVRDEIEVLKDRFEDVRHSQMRRMQVSGENINTAYIYLNMLQESREIASSARHLLRSVKGLGENVTKID